MKFEDVKVGMEVRRAIDSGSNMGGMKVGDTAKVLKVKSGVGVELTKYGTGHDWGALEPVSEPTKHKFHVGQPVRCINSINKINGVVVGTIYTVTGFEANCLRLEEMPSQWTPSQFEPAYSLEVGCKVRVVDLKSSPTHNGREGCVTNTFNECGKVKFHGIDCTYQFDKDYLIVLEPAPKKVKSKGMAIYHDESSFVGSRYDAITEQMKKHIKVGHLVLCSTPNFDEVPYGSTYPYLGFDWAGTFKEINKTDLDKASSIHGTINGKWNFDKFIFKHGGNSMEKETLEKLAERMKDEYVGFDTTKTLARQNGTVFLKKTGECAIEKRDVTMTLTIDDIESLLKAKGITKALGTFEVETYSDNFTVGIIKFVPIESKKNEAV